MLQSFNFFYSLANVPKNLLLPDKKKEKEKPAFEINQATFAYTFNIPVWAYSICNGKPKSPNFGVPFEWHNTKTGFIEKMDEFCPPFK